MEKQTVRITLRMSERLYNLLMESAGEVARPLNTEIVRRLESTFSQGIDGDDQLEAKIREIVRDEMMSAKT